MAFQIGDLSSTLDLLNGVQKTTLFSAVITIPSSLSTFYNIAVANTLQFLCMEVDVPSPEMQIIPVRRYGYGMTEDMPFNAGFASKAFTFIGDGQGLVTNFFRDWQRSIFEYSSENDPNAPAKSSPNITSGGPISPYLVNYKNGPTGYSTQINIQAWTPIGVGAGPKIDSATYMEAYPVNIEDLHYSWAEVDKLTVIRVTISFRDIMYDSGTRPAFTATNPLTNNTLTIPSSTVSILSSIASSVSSTAARLVQIIL
jgi:hypothetical protein